MQHLQNKIDKTTYLDMLTTTQAQINHMHLIHSDSNRQRAYIREKVILLKHDMTTVLTLQQEVYTKEECT